jgi:hypothetical protein
MQCGAKWARVEDDSSLSEGGNDVLYPWYMARHDPPAIEDFLYGLTVSALLSGLEVKQRWAQSVREWATGGAYNARPIGIIQKSRWISLGLNGAQLQWYWKLISSEVKLSVS